MPTSSTVNHTSYAGLGLPVQQTQRSTDPPIITNITIDRLFGRYSYSIPEHQIGTLPGEYNRLILLYGDNGSGKTTILRLVFHLLSPMDKKGHRTFLADTPFKRLAITLGDGTVIVVSRDNGALQGSYDVSVKRRGKAARRFPIEVTDDGKIDPDNKHHDRLLAFLQDLRVFPYYLTDNRDFTGDTIDDDDPFTWSLARERLHREYLHRRRGYEYLLTLPDELPRNVRQGQELLSAMRRAEQWLQQQAYSGTSTGLANASNVYLAVLNHLSTASDPQEPGQEEDSTSVRQRLQRLAERAQEYAQFDLGTPFPAKRFLDLIEHASPDRRRWLENALVPHLDSSEAQLDALQDLFDLLVTFTSGVNSFLADKTLRFSARRDGISIHAKDNETLEPSELSSGERQLLLLLCNTLIAREHSRLFIIDEPEISLNVTWQRQLLDVLLDLTAGTDLQFLVATHSIEMVAGHRESLARLVNDRAS